MTADEIYWPYVAMAVGAVATIPVLYLLALRRWSWVALLVAFANLTVVFMTGAAPIRGALDPNYVGFGNGFLHADKGLAVTYLAGGLVLASAISAWIAVRNRPGLLMLFVAAVSAFHVVNTGFPLADALLANPNAVKIQFGEYLTVPPVVAIPAMLGILVLPFLIGLPWALQRMFEAE